MDGAEWSLSRVFDVVGDTIPDRDMIVWGDVRRTFGEALARADALAAALHEPRAGCPPRASRARELGVRPGSRRGPHAQPTRARRVDPRVLAGARRAVQRQLPVHRGRDRRALPHARHAWRVYERGSHRCSASAGTARRRDGRDVDVLVELDDGSDAAGARRARSTSSSVVAVATARPPPDGTSPDDIYIACTGGTTGRPKAVLWRQGDLYVAAIGGTDEHDEATIRARAEAGAGVWFPTSPLMHVAAQWTVFLAASMGATVVLHDDCRRFDAADHPRHRGARACEHDDDHRRRVRATTARGAAHERVRPLGARRCSAPEARPPAPSAKDALAELLPDVTIRDGYGASEIGAMGSGDQAGRVAQTQRFQVIRRRRASSPTTGPASSTPTTTEVGWIARTGHVPLGYLDDEAATERDVPGRRRRAGRGPR